MDIFFTSFSQGKLGDEAAVLFTQMNRVLSDRLGARDYGPGLTSWFLMFILVPPDFPAPRTPNARFTRKRTALSICGCMCRSSPSGLLTGTGGGRCFTPVSAAGWT